MGKSFSKTDFARWLFQQEKEDRSGEAVVIQQQDELQGHCRAQTPPDTIEFSSGNTDAAAAVTIDGFMSQVMQEQWLDGTSKVDSVTGAGCLPQELYDKFGKGGVGDSTKLSHPAPDLAGTVSARAQAVVAMYPSCSDKEKESSSITTADSTSKKAVSFGLIQVREYNRVVGDNPTVRVGPPMSIGWEFVQKQAVPVDDYEKIKRPRTSDLRIMGSITRKSILRYEFDVSLKEIRAAEKIIRKIQRQRCRTIQQGKMATAIEYAMELAKRKIHRIFSNESSLEIQQKVQSPT
jgi:hypothetical protein